MSALIIDVDRRATAPQVDQTRNVAALKRARDQEFVVHPGQDIETYDPSYYETQLIRAVESVLSPLGRDRTDIRRELAETQEMDLIEYVRVE